MTFVSRTVSRGVRVLWLFCASFAASCGGDAEDGEPPATCAAAGRWALGDDNLFMEVGTDCVITNFCSILEGIHTRGTVTDTELKLDAVGGAPLTFSYMLSGGTLTIVDGNGMTDLPLTPRAAALPASCPPPP